MAAGLWADADENERAFLKSGVWQISEQAFIQAGWLAESIVCLLWALRQIAGLPAYDEQSSSDLFTTASIHASVEDANLRPVQHIERQRGIAELWHWRCRTASLLESGQLAPVMENGTTIQEIIGAAVTKASEAGDVPNPIENDFPAFGKPFRAITRTELLTVTSIAQERHRAFNWLCGYAPNNLWAETPTDT